MGISTKPFTVFTSISSDLILTKFQGQGIIIPWVNSIRVAKALIFLVFYVLLLARWRHRELECAEVLAYLHVQVSVGDRCTGVGGHHTLYCYWCKKNPIGGAWLPSSYLWAFRISLLLIKFPPPPKKSFLRWACLHLSLFSVYTLDGTTIYTMMEPPQAKLMSEEWLFYSSAVEQVSDSAAEQAGLHLNQGILTSVLPHFL